MTQPNTAVDTRSAAPAARMPAVPLAVLPGTVTLFLRDARPRATSAPAPRTAADRDLAPAA